MARAAARVAGATPAAAEVMVTTSVAGGVTMTKSWVVRIKPEVGQYKAAEPDLCWARPGPG
jgi:hypothetical protein